jgi:hypothetical protein
MSPLNSGCGKASPHINDAVPMSMCGAPLALLAAETGGALPPGLAFDTDGNPTQGGRVLDR